MMYGRCKESSQFEPHITWGCKDYVDYQMRMKWPSGYVQHYIAKWNVMPTQAFFQYVLYCTAHPFPGFGASSSGPSYPWLKPQYKPPRPQLSMKTPYMAATSKSCPLNKIVNPESGRCVLRPARSVGEFSLGGKYDLAWH